MIISGVTLQNVGFVQDTPPFIISGALLYLDSGQTSSYPGSGSTWTDLSGNSNTTTLYGSPTYSSSYNGTIAFNGTTAQYGAPIPSKFNVTYTGKTTMFAARMNASAWTNGVSQYRCLFGTNTGTRNFNTYIYHDTSNLFYIHYSANGLGGLSNSIPISTNQWIVVAVTQTTGGVLTYYLNGQQVGSPQTGITFAQYAGNGGEFVAAGDNYWYGDLPVVAVYGRTLSSAEVAQNFNSIRSRYGI